MHNLKYLSFIIIAICVLFLSCEKKDSTIIDPVLNFPAISSASITPSTFDTNLVHGVARVVVSSVDPIQKVTVQVTDPANADRGTFQLLDNGVAPDDTANDGVYSGYVNFSMDCRLRGQYKALFIAQATTSYYSNTITVIFNVISNQGLKPILSNLIAPDSLQRPISGYNIVFLRVTATDPVGACNIKWVFFNSYKPDGSGSGGNPFAMYDDGDSLNHCDQIVHDGNYSLCIAIDNQAQLGSYTFKFNAQEWSGALSDTLIHHIYVHQ